MAKEAGKRGGMGNLPGVSRTFMSAAEPDEVWERLLPPDYSEILERAVDPVRISSKKDLFHHLCTNPVLIDEGRKSFSLERSTGKKCYMLSARDITIIWSQDPQYWRWVSLPPEESRFSDVAELLDVCWLEIRGQMTMAELSPITTWIAPDHRHGLLAGTRGRGRTPRMRTDGWMEIALGDFFTHDRDQEESVQMGLYETKDLWWKKGLIVQGIELRPNPPVNRPLPESDEAWELLLPPDYSEILQRAVDPVRISSKKDLFHRLCANAVLIDGGRKSFSLERSTGKKCYMLSARDITIIWSQDAQYWRWVSLPPEESRFSDVAELLDVCWLEIRGQMTMAELSPMTTYSAFLIFKLDPEFYGFYDRPLETRLSIGGLPPTICTAYLQGPEEEAGEGRIPRVRTDGWMEIVLGDFFTHDRDQEESVQMGLYEINDLWWKKGLIVQGIELRPNPPVNCGQSQVMNLCCEGNVDL